VDRRLVLKWNRCRGTALKRSKSRQNDLINHMICREITAKQTFWDLFDFRRIRVFPQGEIVLRLSNAGLGTGAGQIKALAFSPI